MRRQCRVAATLGLWAAVTLLAACAALQNAAPQTPRQALVYTYATIEAGYNTNVARMESGAIARAEGAAVNGILDGALQWADLANLAFDAGREADAVSYLRMATVILDELERRAKP